MEFHLACVKNILTKIAMAKTNSTLLRAENTSLPIPNPNETVIPGALNLSQASMKLIAHTNPIHRKVEIRAVGFFTSDIIVQNWEVKQMIYRNQDSNT